MADLKERLLLPKPQSAVNIRDASYRPSASGRQPFQDMDLSGLKKPGQGLRSWIRVDTSGTSQYVVELQRRLTGARGEVWQLKGPELSRRRSGRDFDNVYGSTSPDCLPFEFRALEVALEAACTFLDSQAAELEIEAYSLLDELTSKISTLNLEHVR